MSNLRREPTRLLPRVTLSLLLLGQLGTLACQKRPSPEPGGPPSGVIRFSKNGATRTQGMPATPAPTAKSVGPESKPPESAADIAAKRYEQEIRPIFARHGCASGSCHSAFRGGGFYFTGNDERELANVRARIDPKEPKKSELLLKATGAVLHNGGRNIAEGSCDYRRLLAWIGDQPSVVCSDDPPRDAQRFAREVAPAMQVLGCATCHAESGAAKVRLDLSAVRQAGPAAASDSPSPAMVALYSAVERIPQFSYTPWSNTLLQALLAMDGKHDKKFDRRSCAFRRVYGYIANAPELGCDVNEQAPPAAMPDYDTYVKSVFPLLNKRACFDTNCHGGGVPDMTLRGTESGGLFGWHDFIMITARIEDFSKPAKSMFLTTIRNEQPHGGGQRLGGRGDCVDDTTWAWLTRQPITPCPTPKPPSYERFVKEVQPVLDKMTCTQKRCHGESLPHYVIKPFPKDDRTLRANYEWTLRKINVDFMPFSDIMLRMRQPCAYAKVGAWIENKVPVTSCEVVTPPASIFPRLDDIPEHQPAKPGPPPPVRKI